MKDRTFFTIAVLLTLYAIYSGLHAVYRAGYRAAKDEIPSCLYLRRPINSPIKPWGYDGKEGVDWYCNEISGGGYFVSLEKWKRGRELVRLDRTTPE